MTLFSEHFVGAYPMVPPGSELESLDELSVKTASVTLDDERSPYVQVTVVCAIPPEAQLEALDPRLGGRVQVLLRQKFLDWNAFGFRDTVYRWFDLTMVARDVDHTAGEATFTLWSDEAELLTWALVSLTPERTYGLSVKTAVAFALSKIGAVLQPGAADGSLVSDTLEPTITNLVPNPNLRTSVGSWVAGGANGTLVRATGLVGGPVPGVTTRSRTTWTGNSGLGGGGASANTAPAAVVSGQQYTFAVWALSNVARQVNLGVQYSGSFVVSPVVALVANVWTRVVHTVTVPAGVTAAAPYLYPASGQQWVAGNVLETLGWMCVSGSSMPADSFDGATADTGLYDFAWTGAANASSSTKTHLPHTDATIWEPGVTAWDYVTPLLQATNLRLFCDEQRQWFLQPSGTTIDALVSLGVEQNVTEARETISLVDDEDGLPRFFAAVVLKYRDYAWDGSKRYDIAGSGAPVLTMNIDRPWPGPGAAGFMLARAEGRGRSFDLEAMSSYTATPGMTLAADLPETPTQTGYLSAVTWQLPANRMTVRSRGLIDTPPESWLFVEVGLSWDDVAAGIDWTEFTP